MASQALAHSFSTAVQDQAPSRTGLPPAAEACWGCVREEATEVSHSISEDYLPRDRRHGEGAPSKKRLVHEMRPHSASDIRHHAHLLHGCEPRLASAVTNALRWPRRACYSSAGTSPRAAEAGRARRHRRRTRDCGEHLWHLWRRAMCDARAARRPSLRPPRSSSSARGWNTSTRPSCFSRQARSQPAHTSRSASSGRQSDQAPTAPA